MLVALLLFAFTLNVLWFFLAVPWVGLLCEILVFLVILTI